MAEDEVKYRLVLIGGSAGSLDLIFSIVETLPVKAGLSYVIIVHRRNDAVSILTELLKDKTMMKVKEVEDKEPLLPDHVYLAPSDYHLLFEDEGSFSLDSSERVHFSRPSIDVTFECAAQVFGKRIIAILLSGANADGAEGLRIIKLNGGHTIVQDPETAEVGYMPKQAIDLGAAERIVEGKEIGRCLREMIGER